MTAIMQNPVFKGFNPNPSFIFVEDTYYIAVSKGQPTLLARQEQPVLYSNKVYLKFEVNKEEGQFYYSLDDKIYVPVGEVFDTTICSDEHAWGFTGTMVGMACQDLFMHEHYADFKTFIYEDK